MQLSQHQAEETFELQDFQILRNTILCSISRYQEFLHACEQLLATAEYTVTASASVSHSKVYIADNEGVLHTYEVFGDELDQFGEQ